MSEQVATPQDAPAQEQPNAELAQAMAISLNGGIMPQTAVEEPTADVNAGQSSTEVQEQQPTPFQFDTLKEKFGYEKPEDVISEIESLRQLKANPVKEEIKFENEQSQKLYEAIKGGKQNEVVAIIAQQEKLDNLLSAEINKDNAVDIIKMGMQLKYKDLTSKEIDYKFNKSFGLPKEPVQGVSESDDDFALVKQEWSEKVAEIEMEREIEAKLLKPELQQHKSKLVLPEVENTVDERYIQWQKSLEADELADIETVKAYKSLTPNALETKINFKDEANKIDFNFEYMPTDKDFANSIDLVTDIEKFYGQFKNQDGTPDRVKYAKVVHFGLNAESILLHAMNQAKNATLKALLAENSGSGEQRHQVEFQQPNELDTLMKQSLQGY